MSESHARLCAMSDADAILKPLDPEQREVATTLTGPMVVLAGAGTGKTRAITHRIAYGVRTGTYRPSSVLAVTFTARAAGEMRTRLRALGVAGVQARTFHAAALRQLRHFWPEVIGGGLPALLEHKAPLVAHAARLVGLTVDRIAVRDLASEIEWTKVALITPEDYELKALNLDRPAPAGFTHAQVARLTTAYEDAKTERGVIDFEDMLQILCGIMVDHPRVAEKVRAQYRHFLVDEYQDVSPLQQLLLDLWLGSRDELCVVGDPAQTIYSFTGATPNYLTGFRRRFKQAREVRLIRDYRSTPQVVHLANEVLRHGKVSSALELIAQRPAGPPVTFCGYDDDDAEAAGIAAKAARLIKGGTAAAEIAILYRTNAQSAAFEAALSDAGIGFVLRGGERFFERSEVRDAIRLLRGAARSPDADQPMPELVRDVFTSLGWGPQPPAARGAVRDRWDALQALVGLADDLADLAVSEDRVAGLPELLEELEQRASTQHAPVMDGITLSTLHAAKGLEWDAVFLAGMSEGLLPISLAESDDAVTEERRLLYVGVTRAREHLELSYARARNPGGRATRKRSRFLDGLWPDEVIRSSRNARGTHRSRSVALPSNADPALFEALRQWRLQEATVAGKPAFTVFTDSVLAQIATLRPTTVPELVRISGIGPAKLERYGQAVLKVVSQTQ